MMRENKEKYKGWIRDNITIEVMKNKMVEREN